MLGNIFVSQINSWVENSELIWLIHDVFRDPGPAF